MKSNLPQAPKSLILCPQCGTQKAQSQAVCGNCGTRACPAGHLLGQFSQYCPRCNWKDPGWKPPERGKAQEFAAPEKADVTETKPENACPICRARVNPRADKCLSCGFIFNAPQHAPLAAPPAAAASISRATITPIKQGYPGNMQPAPLVMPVKPDYACPQCKSRVPPHTNKCLTCGFVGEMTYIIPHRSTTVPAPFPVRQQGVPPPPPMPQALPGRAQITPVRPPSPSYPAAPMQRPPQQGPLPARPIQPVYPQAPQTKGMAPEVQAKRNCPNCQTGVPTDSRVCPGCGYHIGANRPPSKIGMPADERMRNVSMPRTGDISRRDERSYDIAGTDVKEMGGRRGSSQAREMGYKGEKRERTRERDAEWREPSERKFPMVYLFAILLLSAAIVAVIIVITSKMFAPTTPAVSTLIIKNVTAAMITENQAKVEWATNDPSSSQVIICDPDGICTWTEPDKTMVTAHTVSVPNIKPGTKYHLTVKSIDSGGHEATAETSINSSGAVPTTPAPTTPAAPTDTTPPVITDVSASSITESTVIIKWTTDKETTSLVEYGTATSYGTSTTADEKLVTSHSVSISGLTSDTTYHFRVKSKNAAKVESVSEDKTFKTLSPVPIGTAKGNRAPDFTLKTVNGEDVTLSSLKGKVVLLNFWATWCGPCVEELPYIQAIKDTWTKKELVVLALAITGNAEELKAWLATKGYTFTILVNSGIDSVYKVSTVPTTYFIDASGIIKESKTGSFSNQAEIEALLNTL